MVSNQNKNMIHDAELNFYNKLHNGSENKPNRLENCRMIGKLQAMI